MNEITKITSCRICGSEKLIPTISLGDLYVTGFVDDSYDGDAVKAPLELVLCEKTAGGCGLLQTLHTYPHNELYKNYWYRSGVNQTMTNELHGIAQNAQAVANLSSGDYVIDIGSNDSTLLDGYTAEGLNRVGFEPAENIVKEHNKVADATIITDFFNHNAWKEKFGDKKAQAITSVAMFYDLDNPHEFVGDVVKCLDPDGLFIIQMNYLPSVLDRNAFDGICHEHLEFYSLDSLEYLLNEHGLEIFDVQMREEINEGSFRTFIRFKDGGKGLSVQEGAQDRLQAMRDREKALKLDQKETYLQFSEDINAIKDEAMTFINQEHQAGKKIYAYGASTKGGILLQFFGLDETIIEKAAERNPDKFGKKMVGIDVPIVSEKEARADKPDYFFILPWHFLPEFLKREKAYFDQGGAFIVPLPYFEVITKENYDEVLTRITQEE